MAYNHFDYVPSSVSHNRSVFKFDKAIATGGEIGYLYPMCAPVRMFPGSSISLDLGAEVRSGSLIAPLMDELVFDCFAFKVPNRIVWEHWKQFLGAVDDVLFDNLTEYEIPSFLYNNLVDISPSGTNDAYYSSHLLGTCFELPHIEASDSTQSFERINALPFRGYTFIWNEFFRPEQLVDPILFSKTDDGASGQNMSVTTISINFNGITLDVVAPGINSPSNPTPVAGGCVLPTFRVHKSLWTSCLPKPSLETLNLLGGLSAPVGFFPLADGTATAQAYYDTMVGVGSTLKKDVFTSAQISSTDAQTNSANVVADLNQALLTVNNYRETIMLQNYYDALNRAGSRYDELLRTLFHTNSPEAVIDIPELIVHKRFIIYRKEVVATATTNYGESNVQTLGSQGSYIDTVVKDSFFTTSCTEHSYVHMLWTIRPLKIRMGNGIEPKWTQLAKFDQYYPQFDGMGDVARYNKELYVSATVGSGGSGIFGYQEYGAEDKYQRNSAVGWMNPNVPYHIPGFTLTEVINSAPSLIPSERAGLGSYISCIVEEEAFARCLAISDPQVAPQFILDIRLNGVIVHPMPVYNIPGMGDLL